MPLSDLLREIDRLSCIRKTATQDASLGGQDAHPTREAAGQIIPTSEQEKVDVAFRVEKSPAEKLQRLASLHQRYGRIDGDCSLNLLLGSSSTAARTIAGLAVSEDSTAHGMNDVGAVPAPGVVVNRPARDDPVPDPA